MLIKNISPHAVAIFLKDFAQLIDKGKVTVLTKRSKNRQLMNELMFTIADILVEIKNLKVSDFQKQDFDRNHDMEMVWIFIKEIEGIEVYIKIQHRDKWGYVISFHKSDEEKN